MGLKQFQLDELFTLSGRTVDMSWNLGLVTNWWIIFKL